MNKENAILRRVPNPLPEAHVERPGDFSWSHEQDGRRTLYVCLPGGNRMDAIHVQRGNPGGPRVWGWDGNEDKPTLIPSIDWPGHWHGHLVAGVLESCP
jgi:hypothetical protein